MALHTPATLRSVATTKRTGAPTGAGPGEAFLVVCLCAEWCDTCREFRNSLTRIADRDPAGFYVWLDIEDESALVGDLDIENFPTLAVFRGDGAPLFFGVTLPQEAVVQRTLTALREPGARPVAVPEPISALPLALQA